MNALIPAPGFDFSKYQSGDVVIINMHAVMDDKEKWDDFMGELICYCRRKGIDWTMDHDQSADEVRISFN